MKDQDKIINAIREVRTIDELKYRYIYRVSPGFAQAFVIIVALIGAFLFLSSLTGCNSRIHPNADAKQKESGREVSQVVIGDPSAEIQKYTGASQQKPKPVKRESY